MEKMKQKIEELEEAEGSEKGSQKKSKGIRKTGKGIR